MWVKTYLQRLWMILFSSNKGEIAFGWQREWILFLFRAGLEGLPLLVVCGSVWRLFPVWCFWNLSRTPKCFPRAWSGWASPSTRQLLEGLLRSSSSSCGCSVNFSVNFCACTSPAVNKLGESVANFGTLHSQFPASLSVPELWHLSPQPGEDDAFCFAPISLSLGCKVPP